jgi:hypothetical protein
MNVSLAYHRHSHSKLAAQTSDRSTGLPAPVDVMIDGEVATLECRSLDIVPAAVDVFV